MLRTYARPVAVLTLLLAFAGSSLGAAAGKGAGAQHGKAAEQMSERGRANNNAQWSADPDRGWVRADERHRLHDKNDIPEKNTNRQQKFKGKAKKL